MYWIFPLTWERLQFLLAQERLRFLLAWERLYFLVTQERLHFPLTQEQAGLWSITKAILSTDIGVDSSKARINRQTMLSIHNIKAIWDSKVDTPVRKNMVYVEVLLN